jgi:glucans biosynthesis protein
MHGGAPGSGAPLGNRNTLRHGHYTAEAIAWRRALRALLRESRELVEEV